MCFTDRQPYVGVGALLTSGPDQAMLVLHVMDQAILVLHSNAGPTTYMGQTKLLVLHGPDHTPTVQKHEHEF